MPHELLRSRTVYDGQFVRVRIDEVDLGTGIVEREIVEETGEGVLVVAITGDGEIVLVEQSRHLFGTTYEVPSGAINPGETPTEAARRELREEAGLDAGSFQMISAHVNSVHMTGRNYYFLATDLSECEPLSCDSDEEFIGRAAFSFDEVNRLIAEDRIPDVRNRGCIWLAQLKLLTETAISDASALCSE
ncbi:NUDIX domain-containing protein [Sphingobium yanoikuyae]|uniref:GDP-mannose pyrophosphatase n=2 Tax=Sphingobium yanoikuyae TaxID=13690 RepID=K9CJM9_SPHYA|nr:NUDIX hydrolase [Sphingobium yanoikuyae]EKU72449.1 hypothetical protein HMPREF9718_04975 [Sphingobium yanoikuyae ATCC 51230]QHD69559.1 NUDIX domain-containing protein [Sphingobium yanoikuyae]WQE09989.1 NUDIX hydrolase [Sphingobium yanoikuyae]